MSNIDNRDNRDMIKIPMSLEKVNPESSSYFFSATKGVQLALALIPGVIYVPYVSTLTPGRPQGLLMGILSYALALVIFFRVVIFEEPKWKKIFRDLERNKISNHKYFWGIDRVDDNGVIHYKYSGGQSLRKGVVIKLVRTTVIGKGKDYEKMYQDSFRLLLNGIFRKGLELDVYDALETDSVPNNILSMHKKAKKIEDELTRDIALEHVRNLALISKKAKNLEVIYLTVYFENPRLFKHINSYIEDIRRELEGTKFFKVVNVLNREDTNRYIAHTLYVRNLPDDAGVVDVPDFKKYGEIRRLFDSEGNEEWVEGTTVTERKNRRVPKEKIQQEDEIDYDLIEKEFDMNKLDEINLDDEPTLNINLDKFNEVIDLDNYEDDIINLEEFNIKDNYIEKTGLIGRSMDKIRKAIQENILDGEDLGGVDENYEYEIDSENESANLDIYKKEKDNR